MKRIFSLNKIYFALIIRMVILLFVFTLSRVLFYIFNAHYFSVGFKEFWAILAYGLRFDMATIVLVNSVYIFFQAIPFNFRSNKAYQRILEIFFYITNAAAIFLNCVDMVYFRYISRRLTYDIVMSVFIGDDFRTVFWKYVADYWYILAIWILLVALMIFLYIKTRKALVLRNKSFIQHLSTVLVFIFILGISVIFFRGGFQLRPISLVTAGEYTTADNVPVIINTPFSIYSTSKKQDLKEKNYFNKQTAIRIYNPIKIQEQNKKKAFRKLNVIIVIVESLSKEYIGALNRDMEDKNYTGYTPFLDSLIGQSLCFNHMYANSKRSIEGIPSIISGLPSLMEDSYLTSSFSGNKINSLPLLLKKYGYTSMFFHGGKNGTLNFDAYAKMAGFDHYFGKNEYNNDADYDGKWGIYDEEFLQYAANTMNKATKPFIAAIFTLSSHHPYLIPSRYKNKFRKGPLEIHESIMYTDYALKRFFSGCYKMSWFDSTLFVITADHSSVTGTSEYMNNVGAYSVPLILYMHNSNLRGLSSTICQQADIMPSVLDFLNFNEKYVALGSSVFDSSAVHFSLSWQNSTYQLIKDSFALQFNGEKSLALYNIINDKHLENNLLKKYPGRENGAEDFIKAFIQSYNYRMIQNKLTDPDE